MKEYFEPKALYEVAYVNERARDAERFVGACEAEYAKRVTAAADKVMASGSRIVLVSGPSSSGKTTSSLRLSREFKSRGVDSTVVSLDNFFKNINDYPRTPEGGPDMESLYALDIDGVHDCFEDIVARGSAEIPVFDFVRQRPSGKREKLSLKDGGVFIIEGIHALNPVLTEKLPAGSAFGIYAGLRAEYCESSQRVLNTRSLRITRRLIRDYLFRGHSVRNTLEMWERLKKGEEKWIKPFRDGADTLLDTSFVYEPCIMAPIMEELCADKEQGGDHRDVLLSLCEELAPFAELDVETVPRDSMIREFYGGLEL